MEKKPRSSEATLDQTEWSPFDRTIEFSKISCNRHRLDESPRCSSFHRCLTRDVSTKTEDNVTSNAIHPHHHPFIRSHHKAAMPKQHSSAIYFRITPILSFILLILKPDLYSPPSVQCLTNHFDVKANQLKHSVRVQPLMFDPGSNSKTKPLVLKHCLDKLKIKLEAEDELFVIDLVRNKRLISDKYYKIFSNGKDNLGTLINEIQSSPADRSTLNQSHVDDDFYRNHRFLKLHDADNERCHYHGTALGNPDNVAAISIVNCTSLEGLFVYNQMTYHLVSLNSTTFLSKRKRGNDSNIIPGLEPQQENLSHSRERTRRAATNQLSAKNRRFSSIDNKVLHEPYQSNSESLYVELLIVHDHSQYLLYDGNTSKMAERTMQIVNIMNAFYRQLNIFIALVGVVLWTEKDEIRPTEDGDTTLNNFLKYRYEKLLPRYDHDNAQLITSQSFNGSVVGKALKGPICTHDHSGGVNTDHSQVPAIVAVTIAHELGHNLGMEHDEEDKCKCPDEKCIMSSSSSTVHPKYWSSCSIEYLEDSRKHGLLDCLVNKPERVFGPICGNGFVEEGEDCDLGEPIPYYGTSKSRNKNGSSQKCARGQWSSASSSSCTSSDSNGSGISNPCCDRLTCKFVGNATCAQGPCCDLKKCSVYNSTEPKVCRPKKSECDFEELCDGKSEQCPQDVHYHDGIECGPTIPLDGQLPVVGSTSYNRSKAYCYNGRCASHESQCQLLWGPSGRASKDICYEQNVHGNTSGNCGYDRKEKVYLGCEPDDVPCGMLHCVHNQHGSADLRKTGKLGYGFESASILTVSFFVMSNLARLYCNGAIIDSGPSVRDPGLVPNGAACGDDRMCLDQKCVPVFEVLYKDWCPSDCNGNGICDNLGVCHCHDGTVGTSCYQLFGPNFHLSLLLYVITFFGPIVALVVLTINHYRGQIKIWWYLHNRKNELKHKAREPNQHRRLVYDASGSKVTISEPIPLASQTSSAKPFYQPDLDPWAETSCGNPTPSHGTTLTTVSDSEPQMENSARLQSGAGFLRGPFI